jgi:hypothetical protein
MVRYFGTSKFLERKYPVISEMFFVLKPYRYAAFTITLAVQQEPGSLWNDCPNRMVADPFIVVAGAAAMICEILIRPQL